MSYRLTATRVPGTFASSDRRLTVGVGAKGFTFAEMRRSGELLAIGEAVGEHPRALTELLPAIKGALSQAGVGMLGYASMHVVVAADDSVWVPDELFVPETARRYLQFVGGDVRAGVLTAHSDELRATSVFAADEQVVTAFKIALPGVQVSNQHSWMARFAPSVGSEGMLVTHWRGDKVDVEVFASGRCLFSNTLRGDVQSLLFRILEVADCCSLRRDVAHLMVCGDVDRELYGQVAQYFNVSSLFVGSATVTDNSLRRVPLYRHALILM